MSCISLNKYRAMIHQHVCWYQVHHVSLQQHKYCQNHQQQLLQEHHYCHYSTVESIVWFLKNYILPKSGIYGVKISITTNKKTFNGIAYLGNRPTFSGKNIFLEVNIFGFKKNLYKKRIKVYFQKFIRADKKFKNSAELIEQMNKDVIFAKKGLKVKLVI